MKEKIEKSNVQEILELNTVQKGILFHYLKEPDQDIYNVQLVFEIHGSFSVSKLKDALYCVQSKNEALRSVFRWEEVKKPVQIILEKCPVEFSFHDLSENKDQDALSLAEQYLIKEQKRRFDLRQLPFRVSVIKTAATGFVLSISHHHILYDGWSTGVLLKELFDCYNQDNKKPDADYIIKPGYKSVQQAQLREEPNAEEEQFWKEYLKEYTITSVFSGNVFNCEPQLRKHRITFPGSELDAFARKHKVTKASILYTAYGILLQKYAGVSDVVFGKTVSGRDATVAGIESIIGNFINTVPFRLRGLENSTMLEAVRAVHSDLIRNNHFDSTSYLEIKKLLNLTPADNVFDSVFVIENYPLDTGSLKKNHNFSIELKSVYENTGIALVVTAFCTDEVAIEFSFNESLINDSFIKSLAGHFIKVLDEIINDGNKKVTSLDILSSRERSQILNEFNDTQTFYPSGETIISLFDQQAVRTPDNVAIRYGKCSISYREFQHQVCQVASYLHEVAGIQPGGFVGVLLDREEHLLPCIMGIMNAGCAYVPIDTRYPISRIDLLIEDSGLEVIITRGSFKNKASIKAAKIIDLDEVAEAIGSYTAKGPLPVLKGTDLAYVIYTSGSTGKPKGVMIEHHSVVNRILWMQKTYPLTSSDVLLQKTPVTFDVSVWELFWWSFTGASLCLLAPGSEKDPHKIQKAIEMHKVTTIHFVPSMLLAFLSGLDDNANDLSSLKRVFASGEALRPNVVNRFAETLHKDYNCALVNLYGPTEATVDVSCYECNFDRDYKVVPIGKPIDNIKLYIIDKDEFLAPIGVAGELCIEGVGLARGYLNNEALSRLRFVEMPTVSSGILYKTGDLARWLPDGNIEFLGRIDEQVKIRGFRIELGEIEFQLSSHPLVKEAVVIAKETDNNTQLVAYYVPSGNVDDSMLRSYLLNYLPDYMVPVYYVALENIPLTSNGKVDKKSLPDPELKTGDNYKAPSNEVELQLRDIVSEVLNIEPEKISITSNFFEIGADSLKLITISNKIKKVLNRQVSITDLFNYPTVLSLASYFSDSIAENHNRHEGAYSPIPPAKDAEYYKLSAVQKRLFFLSELEMESTVYNMVKVIQINGAIDTERLEGTFYRLLMRHESLRTSFLMMGNEPVQKVMTEFELKIEHIRSNTSEIQSVIKAFVRPFDLSKGPLIRIGLIETGHLEHFLIVDMHHIIMDGVSQEIFIKDFTALYANQELPDLSLQYKDYAEWQQAESKQTETSNQEHFWIQEFTEELTTLELPADFPRPLIKAYKGDTVSFELSKEETDKLKAIGDKERVTLFMVLLSAYNILLGKLCNQEDIVVGVPAAGRQHKDLERIIGMFVNTLPFRNYPKGELSFRQFLAVVKQKTLSGFENQDYSYEEILNYFKIERDLGRNTLFDTMLAYHNYEDAELEIPGLILKPYEWENAVSKFDLTLIVHEKNDKLSLKFEYATELYKKETIEKFIRYFREIIKTISSDVNVRIRDIDILSPEEHQLLHGFNDTYLDHAKGETIVSLFEKQASATPNKVAVIYEGKRLTYGELNEQANLLAFKLREDLNVRPGSVIGIMMERSHIMVAGLLGILKSGAAYVPIDPAYPKERIEFILENCGADILLVDKYPSVRFRYAGRIFDINKDIRESHHTSDLGRINTPDDLCYLIYTSGSTGKPKGVMITHKNVVNFFAGMNKELPVKDAGSLLAITSTSFDISVLELFWTLCHGHEILIHPSDISLSGLDRYVLEQDLPTEPMEFGLFFFASYNYNTSDKEKYSLLLETVKYADKEGFKAVWTPERHFHEFGGLYPNPSVISSALAMVTSQIELRSGSIVSPLHDVLTIAEDWSVVDNLSNGRVAVSFASGWNPNDFVLSGGNYQERQKTMYEQIEVVKRLWKGETIKRVNGLGKEVDVRVFPDPIQKDLPVWVTSTGNTETFKSAGAAGANVLTHLLGQDINTLAANIKVYREVRRAAGFDEGKVALMLHTYIGEDIDEVEKVVEKPFTEYLKTSLGLSLSKTILEQAGLKEEDLTEELKDKLWKNAFKRYYQSDSLIGTKSSCSRLIEQLKGIGINEIACLIDFGVPQDKVMEGLKHLNELQKAQSRNSGELVNKPVTMMQSTPSFIKLLKEDPGSQRFLNSLKLLLIGGESVPGSLIRDLKKDNKNVQIYNMYGPTETTIWSSIYHFGENPQKVSIGRPIANTQVYILNKHLQLLPPGVPGELYIGGEGLSAGYWNNAVLTEEKFVPNPFSPGERLYNTGDIARWLPDGNLEYVGRKDYQVKIRGFRIELDEIEKTLVAFGKIKEAVVVVKEENGGDKKIAGYFVSEEAVDITALRKYLSDRLPHYMVPGYLVPLDKFPLTPNGKIDRKRLPAHEIKTEENYVAPYTREEKLLADVWSKVLGVEKIGITHNFFSAGGDSIKSIQIISKMRSLGYELFVRDIFTSQTIRELALKLKGITSVSEQAVITGYSRLTPVQRWLFDGYIVNKHHYNQAVMLNFSGGISLDVASEIFTKLQQHHDALRMTFRQNGDTVYVENKGTDMPVVISEHDLKQNEGSLLSLCEELQACIDLENGPLMKLGIYHMSDGTRLLIVIHHLVIDAVSWRILFEDIETLYQQIISKEALSLPLKTDPYLLWAGHLENYTKTNLFKKASKYWSVALDKQVALIKRDHPGGKNEVKHAKTETFRLTKEQTAALLTKAHTSFNTQVSDILLTALVISIRKQFGNAAVKIDLEGHGREDVVQGVNISRTIGWFTSIFPVILESHGHDLSEIIKGVKETLRKVPNKGIDYLLHKHLNADVLKVDDESPSQIFFNYLGQFDSDIKNKSYAIAKEPTGSPVSLQETLGHDFEILGILADGQLGLQLIYSTTQYNTETIVSLMNIYRESLIAVIDYCCAYGRSVLTPSDISFKELSMPEVDHLQSKYNLKNVCALSPMQETMLYHSLYDSDSDNYFIQTTYLLKGNVNISLVEQAFNELITRHDIFRTIFLNEGYARPLQVILKERKIDFKFRDVREECLHSSKKEVIELYKGDDKAKKFNLSSDILLRITVLQIAGDEFEFIWSYHHVLMDGWCVGVIVKEFSLIYAGLLQSKVVALPPVIPYSRYIAWLEQRGQEASKHYWKDYLVSYNSLATLPKKAAASPENTFYDLRTHQLVIGREIVKQLHQLCGKYGITLYTLFQAAWGILLSRYNNVNDVVFGSVVSGRPPEIEGVESMVGLFINTIPVRIHYNTEDTVASLLQQLQEQVLEGEAHNYHPLAEIQSFSNLGKDLLDHIITFENYPEGGGQEELAKMFEISDISFLVQTHFDLSITVVPSETLAIRFDYNATNFDKDIIEQVSSSLSNILFGFCTDPEVPVKELSLFSPAEQVQIREHYNAVLEQAVEPIQFMLQKSFAMNSARCAIEYQGTCLSYAELASRALSISSALAGHSIPGGSTIGVLCTRRDWLISSLLGILNNRLTFMVLEPGLPQGRLTSMIKQTNTQYIITDQSIGYCSGLPINNSITWLRIDELHDRVDTGLFEKGDYQLEDSLYVYFTSGSTGNPKGVAGKNKGISHFVSWEIPAFNINATFRISQFTNPGFDAFMRDIFVALCSGATICIPDEEVLSSGSNISRWIDQQQITLIHCVPSLFKLFSRSVEPGQFKKLKYILLAGEKILPYELKDWYGKFNDSIQLVNLYGPTETTLVKGHYLIRPADCEGRYIPVRPMPGAQFLVLGAHGQVCRQGAVGEIYIRTPYRTGGYLNLEEANAKSFVSNPFSESHSDLLYKTGDLGVEHEDGKIEVLGRRDHQVKIRGIRIELDDIKENILRYPGMSDAVVVVKEDKDAEQVICGYYVAAGFMEQSKLRTYLSSVLPANMIPNFLIPLAELPKLPNGKLDMKGLPDPYSMPADTGYIAPSNDVESKLVEIWSEVLNMDKELISVDRGFFELGGHSLRMLMLINKINKEYGVQVSLKDVVERRSIMELADYLITIGQIKSELIENNETIEISL